MSQLVIFLFDHIALVLYPATLILVLAIIAAIFSKQMPSLSLLWIGIFYFWLAACGLIPEWLIDGLEKQLKPISVENILSHRAMIVLGGGISHNPKMTTLEIMSYPRILEAYRIYTIAQQHHLQYTLFLSGGDPDHRKTSEAALYQKKLLQLGIPKQYLITENDSKNTYENARNIKKIIKNYPFKQYLLVTSATHMKRAQLCFDHFAIKTIAAPSDFPYPIRTLLPLEYNLALQQIALHEYIGILRFYLYNLLGLNQSPVTAPPSF